MSAADWLLFALLGSAFITDTRRSVIPNVLTVSGFLSGLLYNGLSAGWEGLVFSMWGIAGSTLPILLLYAISAVGAGDVKLFAAVGSIAGLEYSAYAMMYSIIFAGAIGLMILIWRKQTVQRIVAPLFHWFVRMRLGGTGGVAERMLPVFSHAHLRFPFMWAVLPGAMTAKILLAG